MAEDINIASRHTSGYNKLISRTDVERAMRHSKSNLGAARFLGVSKPTYKKYASSYFDEDGVSLYDKHCNKWGVGIPRFDQKLNNKSSLLKVMSGEVSKTFYSTMRFKKNLIKEGLLEEKCNRCDFHEKRVLDLKVPLILNFKDGNKNRWSIDNLELLCYNCYYLCIGDIYDQKQLDSLEDITRPGEPVPEELELPKHHEEAIVRSRNLDNAERPDDFGDDLIVNFKKK